MLSTPTAGLSAREEQACEFLRSKLRALYQWDQLGTHEKVLVLGERLKAHYGDARTEYRLFHLLCGSTSLASYTAFDFPDPEDSVVGFIEREHQRAFGIGP